VAAEYGAPSWANLQSAVAVANASGRRLLITPGNWPVDGDLTITSPLHTVPGGNLAVATAKTMTINSFEAGLYQCFSRAGTGQVVFGSGSVKEVQQVWFGSDTDAIKHALAAVPSGAGLRFNAGSSYTFSPSSSITLTGKSIRLICDPGVEIDATAATCNPLINLCGTTGTYYLLGASSSQGATSITVHATLAALLSPGDLIQLSTSNLVPVSVGSGELWTTGYSGYFKGEFCEVLRVSGTTVYLKEPLTDSYTAANTGAGKITPISGGLNNFRIKGAHSNGYIGIRVYYARDYEVINSRIQGLGLQLSYTVRGLVQNSDLSVFKGSGGTAFPLMLASCQSVDVLGNTILGGFQAISTGGWEPNRKIRIIGNTAASDPAEARNAIGLHENTEAIIIADNHLWGGILGGTKEEIIRDNKIYLHVVGTVGYTIWLTNSHNGVSFINNEIYCPDAIGGASTFGVYAYARNGAVIRRVDLSGTSITGNCVGIRIERANNTAGTAIHQLILDGYKCDLSTDRTIIRLEGYDATYRLDITSFSANNMVLRHKIHAAVYTQHVNITDFICKNSLFWYDGLVAGGIPIYLKDTTTIKRLQIDNNTFNNTTAGAQLWINCGADYLSFTNNVLDNFNAYAGTLFYGTNILFRDNRHTNCLGTPTISGKYFSRVFGHTDNVESWGSAAPTTGAWQKGDVIFNTASAAGGAPGWVCTTTGTFGAATDNTGDTDGSTGVITGMTDTSLFNVGDYVNISAGFATGTGRKILAKTATSITVDANSNSAQSNVTVDTSDPVFKAMANLAS